MAEHVAFSASVEILARVEETFALVSDLRRKALLNPNIRVIRVELEGGGPIGEGSVFHHRFRRREGVVEYRSRVVRWEPPYRLETRSETDPPFEVRVTVEPTPAGCRLTQAEQVEVRPELLDALEPPPGGGGVLQEMLRMLPLFPSGRRLGSELRALQRERLSRRLRGELGAWLEAIRVHLEDRGR